MGSCCAGPRHESAEKKTQQVTSATSTPKPTFRKSTVVTPLRFRDYKDSAKARVLREVKSPKELVLIQSALSRHLLFTEMDSTSRELIITEMQKLLLPPGAEVYVKGASPHMFMVLTSGILSLGREDERTPGEEFGEETFLTDLPRNENVLATTEAILWSLDKSKLIAVKNKLRRHKGKMFERLLVTSKRFQALTKSQIKQLALVVSEVRADADFVLISAGLCTEVCFLLIEGEVSLEGKKRCIGGGQLVGKPCKHTIRTATSVLAWKLEKKDADAALWPSLQITLQQNLFKSALEACNFSLQSYELDTAFRCSTIHSYKQGDRVLLPSSCICLALQGELVFQSQPNSPIQAIRSKPEDWDSDYVLPSDVLVLSKSALVALMPVSLFAVSQKGLIRIKTPISIIQEDLQAVPLFQTMSNEDLIELSPLAVLVSYDPETVIIHKGEMAPFFYVVKSGFAVIGNHTSRGRTIGSGGFFGQRTWLFNQPMISTVLAHTKLICWAFPINSLQPFLKKRTRKWIEQRSILNDNKWALDSFALLKMHEEVRGGGTFLVGNKISNDLFLLSAVTIVGDTDNSDLAKGHKGMGRFSHPWLMSWMPTLAYPPFTYYPISAVPGKSLAKLMKTLPRGFHSKEARFYIACLTLLLEHIHSCHVTFRNLQPDTVLVDATGYPTLIDFKRCSLTSERTYTFATSPWYTAPEIIRREGANIAADYWSLGVLLYECVFRKYPFGRASQSPYEVYNAVLIGEYEFPELIDQELRQVEEIIELLLVPNPAKRLPGGLKALKQHSWFRGLDWVTATQKELLNKKVAAPIKPKVKSFDEKISKISKQQTALHEAIGVRNSQVALKVPSMLDS